MALSGLLTLIFGLLLLFRPLDGALAVAWIVGFYAIFLGLLLLMLAFKVRGGKQREKPPQAQP